MRVDFSIDDLSKMLKLMVFWEKIVVRLLVFAGAFTALCGLNFPAHAASVWTLEPTKLAEADARGWSNGDLKLDRCSKSVDKQLTSCKYSLFGLATVFAFADSEESRINAISLKCKPDICDGRTLETFAVYLLRSVSSYEDEVLSAWVISALSSKALSTPDLNIVVFRDEDGFVFIIQKSD